MAGALGEAVVEILADIDAFDEDVRRRLQESADEAAERVQRDLDRINRAAAETGRRLADSLGGGADAAADSISRMTRLGEEAARAFEDLDADALARIRAEAEQAQAEFLELARAARAAEGAFEGMSTEELENIARAAEDAARQVEDVGQQARQAQRVLEQFRGEELERLAREAQEAADRLARLSRTPLRRIGGEAREAGRAILAAFRGAGDEAEDALRRIDNQRFNRVVRAAVAAALKIRLAFAALARNVDLEDSILRTGRAFRLLVASAVGLTLMATQLSAIAAAAAGLVAALAPAVGILAAIPSALALFAAASGTLRVALLGVGDAVKAAFGDDAEAFEESIKNLAPAAQATAREFRALKPAVDGLRKSVQNAFFKPLEGQIKAVGAALIGPLRAGMTAAAGEFGRLGRAVLEFGKSGEAVGLVEDTFAQLKRQLGGIRSDTITNLLAAVSRFTRSVFPAFDNLGGSIDSTLGRLTDFLSNAAAGGDALRWVREAIATFQQMGRIARNVGSILSSVFSIIRESGGGVLGTIEELTAGLAEFAKSAQGRSDIGAIFTTIATIGAQALPVVKALVSALGTLAPILRELALALGPILTDAIRGLTPALAGVGQGLISVFRAAQQAVRTLADSGAVGEFGRALGAVLDALSPLLPALGSVLVSAFRATAIAAQILAPILRLIANGLRIIAQSPIGAFLGVLVAQFILVRLVTGNWTLALKSLVPVLKLAGKAVLALGRALIAAVVANPITAAIAAVVLVLGFLLTRLEPVRRALARLKDIVVDAFGRLKEFGASLVRTFKTEGAVAALRQLGNGILSLVQNGAAALARFAPVVLRALLEGFRRALEALPGLISGFLRAVVSGLGRVASALPNLARTIAAGLVAAFTNVRAALPGILANLRTAFTGAFEALRTEGPKIAAVLSSLLSSAFNAIASRGPALLSQAFSFLRNGAAQLLILAANAIRTVTTTIASNLPALSSRIASVISGLIGAVGRAIPRLLNSLTSQIGGGVNKAVGDAGTAAASGGGQSKLSQSLINLLLNVLGELAAAVPRLLPQVIAAVARIQLAIITALAKAAPGILLALGNLLLTAAGALLSQLGALLASLPGKLLSLGASLVTALFSLGARAMAALLRAFVTGVGSLIGFVISIPILIVAALARLGIELFNLGARAIARLRAAFAPAGESIPQIFARLPGRIIAALSTLAARLGTLARNALSRMGSAISSGISKVVAFFRGLPGKAASALSGFAGRLREIGVSIMQGLINGAKSLASSFIDAVTAPIRSAIDKAKSLIKFGSPSKVFAEIGESVGTGFIKGLTGTTEKINSTITNLVKKINKAFEGIATKADDRLIKRLNATNKRLQALVKTREKLAETLKKANEFAASVSENVRSFGSVAAIQATGEGALTGTDIAAQLADRLAKIKKFQADIAALAKRGLNKAALQQIVEAGIESGSVTAAALASSSNATISQINETTKEINKAATSLGRSTADLFFDSGKEAGRGFLAGLKGQQAEITKLMTKIAKDAAAAVKKALKIKSPSKVMEGLGEFTIAGFLNGIGDLAPEVERALENAVRIRNALARQLEATVAAGGVTGAGTTTTTPAALTAPAATADTLRALVDALNRLTTADGVAGPRTEVNAPITVNLPTADPDAVGQVIGRRVSSIANR